MSASPGLTHKGTTSSVVGLVICAIAARNAHASPPPSAYCRRVRARAASDASLLLAPSVQVQGLKFPSSGTLDLGTTTGNGYQLRAAASFSLLDFYRGLRVLRVADADCDQHDASVRAQELLLQGSDFGRLPALRKQAEVLDAHRADWQAIVARSDERLAAHVIALHEAQEIRGHAADLDRKREQVRGDVERLEARAPSLPTESLSSLLAALDTTGARFEHESSHVRKLDSWDVRVSGGLIPLGSSVDYFGIAQVGFNLGGFVRNPEENKYVEARLDELRHSRYELPEQLRVLRQQLASARSQAAREREIVARQAGALEAARAALAHSDTPNAGHTVALLDLELFWLDADRAYLDTYVRELSQWEAEDHERQ